MFTLSLDTELAWGSLRRKDERAFDAAYPRSRETVLRLLDLLARRRISATWAVVGHLFLASSDETFGEAFREVTERQHVRRGRPGDERTRPLLYAAQLVSAIQACDVPQEIGSHSFAHQRADALTSAEFRTDLRACAEVAAARGIRLRSFVFPYNVEAHHAVLAEEGYSCYRPGGGPPRGLGGAVRRLGGFAAELARTSPPAVLPALGAADLSAIPPSMFLIPRTGRRRLVPLRSRLDRALAGLDAALARGRVFHLWFHPFNLTTDPEGLFAVLDTVLARVGSLRESGRMEVLTMGQLADRSAGAA